VVWLWWRGIRMQVEALLVCSCGMWGLGVNDCLEQGVGFSWALLLLLTSLLSGTDPSMTFSASLYAVLLHRTVDSVFFKTSGDISSVTYTLQE